MTMTISFQNRGMPAVTTMKGDGMSKSNGCDSNGQNETEGTGGQRGRGQARSKADRLKTKQNKNSHKWFVGVVFQNSLHFEVSSEDVMI